MDRQLIKYLPEFLQSYEEMQQIMYTEQNETDRLWCNIRNLLNESFVSEESEIGASRWEKILDIVPKDSDSLLIRNFRIQGRMVEDLPYTYRTLNNLLKALCGEEGYKIEINYDTFTLNAKVALTAKKLVQEVEDLCERIVPLNLFVNVTLMYNTHELLQPYTHEQLGIYTQHQLREELLMQ